MWGYVGEGGDSGNGVGCIDDASERLSFRVIRGGCDIDDLVSVEERPGIPCSPSDDRGSWTPFSNVTGREDCGGSGLEDVATGKQKSGSSSVLDGGEGGGGPTVESVLSVAWCAWCADPTLCRTSGEGPGPTERESVVSLTM